jgi:hypothetical protein
VSQPGTLVERILNLQRFLVEQAEHKHGLAPGNETIPIRIRTLRRILRRELTSRTPAVSPRRAEELMNPKKDCAGSTA